MDEWIIPNHDAFLVHPTSVVRAKTLYGIKLYNIYRNRHEILQEYLKSIGVECDKIDSKEPELDFDDFNLNTILK